MKVGVGSVAQAGLQSVFGTSVVPSTKLNMTSETIVAGVEKGDEANLIAKKTRNQADVLAYSVDGGLDGILRPEMADWLFHAALGKKTGTVYTLADPNADLPVSTLVISRGGVVKTYPDMTIRSLTITAPAQDYVRFTIDFIGVKELKAGDTGAQTVQSINFTLPSYKCVAAELFYGEAETDPDELTQKLCVEDCTLTIDNGLEEAPATYCTGLYKGRPVPGLRSVTTDFNIPYSDNVEAFKQAYLMDEEGPTVALKLTFSNGNPDENVEIYLPNLAVMSADSNVDGQGIIDSSVTGEALSVGDAEPITVTVNHAA